jgi:hypothetical protein
MICNIATRSDADFVRTFLYQMIGSDGVTTTPIDLTGSSLRMDLRGDLESATVFIELSTDSGNIVLMPDTSGQFTIYVYIDDFEQKLSPGDYVQSLIRTRPDELIEEIWHGIWTHSLGPTR